ncbi:MAG: hypothetical protein EA376_06120 [Phycisphaeraceae bacterium]|nr:MAG: hypothetical protein EA376_06120 [Phycisphaeraceae bacterium]
MFPVYIASVDVEVTFELLVQVCIGDLTGNGAVGPGDLAILLADWGATDSPADLNGDGVVNAQDLGELLSRWGPCPE